jgi:hypothetical protein
MKGLGWKRNLLFCFPCSLSLQFLIGWATYLSFEMLSNVLLVAFYSKSLQQYDSFVLATFEFGVMLQLVVCAVK